MLNINFDLFYELKQGSVVSNTNENVVNYWRVVDGNLEFKTIVANELKNDWQVANSLNLPTNGIFEIVERFQRFTNG
jgi:hypothetical protein